MAVLGHLIKSEEFVRKQNEKENKEDEDQPKNTDSNIFISQTFCRNSGHFSNMFYFTKLMLFFFVQNLTNSTEFSKKIGVFFNFLGF